MTSPLNSDPTRPTAHASSSPGSPAGSSPVNHPASHPYAPSVPISVYRELAGELSSTRIQMDTYKFQNQQLVEQNQKLRLEIERVVQSALYLRQVADGYNGVRPGFDDAPPPAGFPQAAPPKPRPAPKRSKVTPHVFTEQPEPQVRRERDRAPREINGWWLTVMIVAIVITAFGTGFSWCGRYCRVVNSSRKTFSIKLWTLLSRLERILTEDVDFRVASHNIWAVDLARCS